MRVPGLSSLVRAELENRFIQTPFTSPAYIGKVFQYFNARCSFIGNTILTLV